MITFLTSPKLLKKPTKNNKMSGLYKETLKGIDCYKMLLSLQKRTFCACYNFEFLTFLELQIDSLACTFFFFFKSDI